MGGDPLRFYVLLAALLVAFGMGCSKPQQQPASPASVAQLETEIAGKTPQQVADMVFAHYRCGGCHTLGEGGKLGFTSRGKEVSKNFEGCIRLLTDMNVIAQIPEEKRSPAEKHKQARFEEFGCMVCHQITPGKLGLTPVGSKLASLHMSCGEVQKLLANR